jgi:hypothetical protein
MHIAKLKVRPRKGEYPCFSACKLLAELSRSHCSEPLCDRAHCHARLLGGVVRPHVDWAMLGQRQGAVRLYADSGAPVSVYVAKSPSDMRLPRSLRVGSRGARPSTTTSRGWGRTSEAFSLAKYGSTQYRVSQPRPLGAALTSALALQHSVRSSSPARVHSSALSLSLAYMQSTLLITWAAPPRHSPYSNCESIHVSVNGTSRLTSQHALSTHFACYASRPIVVNDAEGEGEDGGSPPHVFAFWTDHRGLFWTASGATGVDGDSGCPAGDNRGSMHVVSVY